MAIIPSQMKFGRAKKQKEYILSESNKLLEVLIDGEVSVE